MSDTLAREIFENVLETCGIVAVFRHDSNSLWGQTYNSVGHQNPRISNLQTDFYLEHGNNDHCHSIDLSCIIKVGGYPVAIWPLFLQQCGSKQIIQSPGGLILGPLFCRDVPASLCEKVSKSCYKATALYSHKIGTHEFTSYTFDPSSRSASPWHIYAMQQGSACTARHEAVIDLSQPIDQIRSRFRKSYKSLINKSKSLWNIRVYSDQTVSEVWQEFVRLHAAEAGRSTRSAQTWEIQRRAIIKNEAFLVAVCKEAGGQKELIGGGYFLVSKHEGVYATAAYKRNLFDKPIGHIVQLEAVKELKARNCQWYHIGRVAFHGETPKPSEKWLSISQFKSGFTDHFLTSYELTQRTSECDFDYSGYSG